jgi:hypothetical protein
LRITNICQLNRNPSPTRKKKPYEKKRQHTSN